MTAETCLTKRNFALGQLDSRNFRHFQFWQDAEICMDAEIVQMSCASYVSKLFYLENEVLETWKTAKQVTTSAESCLIKRIFAFGIIISKISGIFSPGKMLEICMDTKLVQISCGSYFSSQENEALKVWKAANQVTTSAESRLIKRHFAFGIIISKISGISTPGKMLETCMDTKLVQISCGSYVSSHENEVLEAWKVAKQVTTKIESCLIKRNFAFVIIIFRNFRHFSPVSMLEIIMDAELVQISCASCNFIISAIKMRLWKPGRTQSRWRRAWSHV